MESDSCNQAHCTIFEEWYMNKLNRNVEKVLNQENGRPKLKLKAIEEVFTNENKPLHQTNEDLKSLSNLQPDYDDMEIENMTLKQMQRVFKKSSSKASRNASRKGKVTQLSPVQPTILSPGKLNYDLQSDCSLFHGVVLPLHSELGDDVSQSLSTLNHKVEEVADKKSIHEMRDTIDASVKIETGTDFWNNDLSEARLKGLGFAFNDTSSDCKYDFFELSSSGTDCGHPESVQVSDELYSIVHWGNPKVRLVLEDDTDPQHSISSSPPKETVLNEISVHACSNNWNLRPCLNTLKPTALMGRKPYFEISGNRNDNGCQLQSSSVLLQKDSHFVPQNQSGRAFHTSGKGRERGTDKHEMGEKNIEGARSVSSVKEHDVAKDLVFRLRSTRDQRAICYSEQGRNEDARAEQMYPEVSRTSCPLLTDELVSSFGKVPSLGKDKESCKVTEPLTSSKCKPSIPVDSPQVKNLNMEKHCEHHKPTKIPCKRKAMSPLSQKKLLEAVDFKDPCHLPQQGSEALDDLIGMKQHVSFNSSTNAQSQGWVKVPRRKIMLGASNSPEQSKDAAQPLAAAAGSPLHNKEPSLWHKSTPQSLQLKAPCLSSFSCLQALPLAGPQISESGGRKTFFSSDKSLLPHTGKASEFESRVSPLATKGILRPSSQTCKGACKCEQCKSLRFRAEQASQFSRRQMHDIEGLATKLVKELSTMRSIVEENILSVSNPGTLNSQVLEQVKMATMNAFETEEMAKKWLLIMARDCNRYCKIMRMQRRKLTFADEAGGQLCQVKHFQSQGSSNPPLLGINKIKICESDM